QQQFKDVAKTLAASDEALRSFTASHGGLKIPEQSQTVVTRLSQTEAALAEVEANRKMAETRYQAMKTKAASEPSAPPSPARPAVAPTAPAAPLTSPKVQQLRQQLTKLETLALDLRTKYTEEHPRVVLVQNQIADVQRQIAEAVKELRATTPAGPSKPEDETKAAPDDKAFLNEALVLLETSLHTLPAQEEALRKQADGLRKNLSGLSRNELEYSRLVRDVESNQRLYGMLSEKLAGARIREQGEMKVVKVIDPPSTPSR